jgi:hypothetical protein
VPLADLPFEDSLVDSTGKPYGLAILDVQMPKMDGWMLARTIPAEPAFAGTRLSNLPSFGQTSSPAELKTGIEAYPCIESLNFFFLRRLRILLSVWLLRFLFY